MITPNIIERSWIQGTTVAVEYLTGTAFSGENGAHTFRITGKDAEGQPVAVSGTVLAKILRADNITVDVSGSVVDGVAVVTLVGDCYNVPGRTSLVIFLSDGTNTVTLYAAVFNVYRSTSGNEIDSGVNIPSLAELLAQIERMEAATEAAEAATNRAEHLLETSTPTAWNQLNANSGATSTASGVTFTNNGDGTWTLTGNGTGTERKQISAVSLTAGHVYAVLNGGIDTTALGTYMCLTRNGSSLVSFYKDMLFTADIGYNQFSIRTTSSFVAPEGGFVYAPMLIDLTDIYGAGLEPSTIAEFRAKYPHRVYPYAPIGSVRNLDITEVHNVQIAELDKRMDSAEDAIDALESTKADKTDLAYTDERLDVLWKLTHGVAWDTVADNADGYAKTVPQGTHMTEVGIWGGHSDVVGGEIVSADVVSVDVRGANMVNPADMVLGDISASTGAEVSSTIAKRTGFIPVESGTQYAVNGCSTYVEYDANKQRVYGQNMTNRDAYAVYTTQATTKYVRIVSAIADRLQSVMLALGSDTTYRPYAVATHPIPSAVLAQYPPRSAGSVYDTISWDGEKWWHTQRVKSMDCSQYTWTPFQRDDDPFFYAEGTVDVTPSTVNVLSIFGVTRVSQNGATIRIELPDGTDLSTVTIAGIVLYGASTPVVTDITALMGGWHGELPTESGGTITFAQDGNTISPVPNNLTHYRNLSEVN